MSETDSTRVYTSTHRYSDFDPTARTVGRDIWASPDGDLDIVLSGSQWSEWIGQIQEQIDNLTPPAELDADADAPTAPGVTGLDPMVNLVRNAIGNGVLMALEDRAGLLAKVQAAGPGASVADALTADAEEFVRIRADLVEAVKAVRQ